MIIRIDKYTLYNDRILYCNKVLHFWYKSLLLYSNKVLFSATFIYYYSKSHVIINKQNIPSSPYLPLQISFSDASIVHTPGKTGDFLLYNYFAMNDIKILNDTKDFRQQEKTGLYINIFWEEPRNEGYTCTDCNKTFGLSTIKEWDSCTCNGKLERFYDPDKVTKDRWERTTKEGYVGKLAETLDSKLVWFIMWRQAELVNLNREKLKLTNRQLYYLWENIKKTFTNFDPKRFFYLAEVGVDKQTRWQKIASSLYEQMEAEVTRDITWYSLLRTTKKTDTPYRRFQKEWYKDMFTYNDEQDRVIMIKKFL